MGKKQNSKLIIREARRSYQLICDLLCEHSGYELTDLLSRDERPIQSKKAWLLQGMQASAKLLPKLGRIKDADSIVLIGNYSAMFSVFLNKIHVIHPDELFWWGFQIRGDKSLAILKKVFAALYSSNLHFIVFSEYEHRLYKNRLDLPGSAFIYQPYGDWQNSSLAELRSDVSDGGYYFSGGYSNRDYAGLIRAWEGIARDLVIIGSSINSDLEEYLRHPSNPRIKVLLDTSPEEFDHCMKNARACVLPFTANTGASGQTVALRSMRLRKLMISSDIDAMNEYILDNKSGFLVHDLSSELTGIIEKIEKDPGMVSGMLDAQDELYQNRFSYEGITRHLLSIL